MLLKKAGPQIGRRRPEALLEVVFRYQRRPFRILEESAEIDLGLRRGPSPREHIPTRLQDRYLRMLHALAPFKQRAESVDSIVHRELLDARPQFQFCGHPDLGPGSPIDAQRWKPLSAPQRRQCIEEGVG